MPPFHDKTLLGGSYCVRLTKASGAGSLLDLWSVSNRTFYPSLTVVFVLGAHHRFDDQVYHSKEYRVDAQLRSATC